jgi:hypothetical protein
MAVREKRSLLLAVAFAEITAGSRPGILAMKPAVFGF